MAVFHILQNECCNLRIPAAVSDLYIQLTILSIVMQKIPKFFINFNTGKLQMKRKLWMFLPLTIMANIAFASSTMHMTQPEFTFVGPGTIVVKVEDIPGDGFISIYNNSRGTTGRASDDLTITCDNDLPFVVEENQTRYCFDATDKVTITLRPENFKFGASGIIRRRRIG